MVKPNAQTRESGDWRDDLYTNIMDKKIHISLELRKLLWDKDFSSTVYLEEKLNSMKPTDKKSNNEIGIVVLGLVDAYVREGSYEKALDMLDQYRVHATQVANANNSNVSGLLYVALLYGTIYKKLEEQIKGTGTKSNLNERRGEYFSHVMKNYLTPQIEHLMIDTKTT